MIEIRKIYQPQAIVNIWKYINQGVERVVEVSSGDISPESVINDIASGHALLWLVFREGAYLGFIITKIQIMPFGLKTLLIYAAYANKKVEKEEWMEAFKQLDDYAKTMNCKQIDLYTQRDKGFEKILEPYGYKRKYVIFTKEV